MQDSVRVAAMNFGGAPGETSRNLDQLANHCRQAKQEGAELVLFPELSLTGFLPNHPTGPHEPWLREALHLARRCAEPLEGRATQALRQIGRETGLFVAAGLLEDAGNRLFNTHVLAHPDGAQSVWRKMHVPMFEMPFYNGGDVPAVAATTLGRVGANICFDALLPESTRLLAVQQVEIVLFPFAADPAIGWAAWARNALEARCAENGVFGLACNYSGTVTAAGLSQRFDGGSMILGPRGEVLAEGAGPMLLANLEAATLRDARAEPEYLYRFRRPELYRSLAD